MRRLIISAGLVALTSHSLAYAQATGNPSFTAPLPAFVESEMGLVVSVAHPLGAAYEAVYRYRDPLGTVDLTARGGIFEHRGALPRSMLVGLEVRREIARRSASTLVDAAFIAGIGGRVRAEAATFMVPMGVSLGRRWAINESFSIAPYIQPTVLVRYGTAVRSEVLGVLGIGTDLSLSGLVDIRTSVGLGAVRGIAIGAVLTQ